MIDLDNFNPHSFANFITTLNSQRAKWTLDKINLICKGDSLVKTQVDDLQRNSVTPNNRIGNRINKSKIIRTKENFNRENIIRNASAQKIVVKEKNPSNNPRNVYYYIRPTQIEQNQDQLNKNALLIKRICFKKYKLLGV